MPRIGIPRHDYVPDIVCRTPKNPHASDSRFVVGFHTNHTNQLLEESPSLINKLPSLKNQVLQQITDESPTRTLQSERHL